MTDIQQAYSSFRDPAGSIFFADNKIFRSVSAYAATDFKTVRDTGLINELIKTGLLWPEQQVDTNLLPGLSPTPSYLLEHPRLPFISYPYEWSFAALKAAALLHLEIQLKALSYGVTLSDASAYNIQFIGAKPVFIDHLSFIPYHAGSLWQGYNQFCREFLNPLLLRAYIGIPHNPWYRSQTLGIDTETVRRLLSFHHKFSPHIFTHVVLQSMLQKTANRDAATVQKQIKLPLKNLQKLLINLQQWINQLHPKAKQGSAWSNYSLQRSYSETQQQKKAAAIAEFCSNSKAKLVWDLGCNVGEYANIALANGAVRVIGFDSDYLAIEKAFHNAAKQQLSFLPLYMDIINPSPNQGFAEQEYSGLLQRSPADALMALAIIHHLAIGQNVPLKKLAGWITNLAPQGIVEFVSKEDPLVKELLMLRKDIFNDYSLKTFLSCLQESTTIIKIFDIIPNQRWLIWYYKKP